jgi:uncharacterized membrane protein YgdD (TMEM256/DUF423 family)
MHTFCYGEYVFYTSFLVYQQIQDLHKVKLCGIMVLAAAFFGFSGVTLGALGAHYLRNRLDEFKTRSWSTATQYQLLHAVAMLVISLAAKSSTNKELTRKLARAYTLFGVGIVGFSGSIYVLCLDGPKFPFGPMTPLGGLTLMAGWASLALI